MAELSDWNVSAGSNNSAPPAGWPEGMAPSDVNNTAREGMAVVKRWYNDISFAISAGGSSNAFTMAAARTISAYAAGQVYGFIANHSVTGATTLNVDSVGAKAIRKNYDQAIASGDIVQYQLVLVAYDAQNDRFQLLSPTATAGFLLAASNLSDIASAASARSNIDAMEDVFTTRGDIVIRDASAAVRLAISATAGAVLKSDGTDPSWSKAVGGNGATADEYGFRGIPVASQSANASFTFAAADTAKLFYHTSGSAHTWTIDSNANLALAIGSVFILENENGGGNIAIAITSDTLRWGSSTGSRTLAANGSAVLKKVAATVWRLTGTGIT